MSKLIDTFKRQVRQAEDLSIPDGQDGDLDFIDTVNQTVNQLLSSKESPRN